MRVPRVSSAKRERARLRLAPGSAQMRTAQTPGSGTAGGGPTKSRAASRAPSRTWAKGPGISVLRDPPKESAQFWCSLLKPAKQGVPSTKNTHTHTHQVQGCLAVGEGTGSLGVVQGVSPFLSGDRSPPKKKKKKCYFRFLLKPAQQRVPAK